MKSNRSTTIWDPPDEVISDFITKYDEELSFKLQEFDKIYSCGNNDQTLSLPDLISLCNKNNLQYIDASFPPKKISLLKTSTGEAEQLDKPLKVHWLRPRYSRFSDYKHTNKLHHIIFHKLSHIRLCLKILFS